jgi:hypothetical protein
VFIWLFAKGVMVKTENRSNARDDAYRKGRVANSKVDGKNLDDSPLKNLSHW